MTRPKAVGKILDVATETKLPEVALHLEPPSEPVREPTPIPVGVAPDPPPASSQPSPVSLKARQRRFDLMLDAALRDEVREAARLADQEGRAAGGDGMELSGAMIVRAALRVTLRDARLAPKV